MTHQQQSCPFSAAPAGSFAHELGSSNSCTQINNARCPSPSSSLLPPSASPPPPPPPLPSSTHGRVMLDHPLCLSSIHSIPPLSTTSDHALQLEYSISGLLEESPFHPDTISQPPFLAISELIPDYQEYYKPYMTDTDEEIGENIFQSLQFEWLPPCYERESLVRDCHSYSQDDDICSLRAASLLQNLDTHSPATMSDNISNFTGPELPNSYQNTDLKCLNQEDAISFTGRSSPAAFNVTHGYVGQEAADECSPSDLVGDMSEQINPYKDHGVYTVILSVNTDKLDFDDGYRWRKYGRKKIKSKGDDHARLCIQWGWNGKKCRKEKRDSVQFADCAPAFQLPAPSVLTVRVRSVLFHLNLSGGAGGMEYLYVNCPQQRVIRLKVLVFKYHPTKLTWKELLLGEIYG